MTSWPRSCAWSNLPAEELVVLRTHGFEISKADLERAVYRVRRTARPSQHREITPSRALSAAGEALEEAAATYQANEDAQREHLRMLARDENEAHVTRETHPSASNLASSRDSDRSSKVPQ